MNSKTRTDVHRPSEILPEEYDLVSYTYDGPDPFLQMEAGQERRIFNAHMDSHPGAVFFNKENETGGCSICGAHFSYGAIFYHRDSNRYIKIGWICAMKMDSSLDGAAFRNWKERIKSGAEVRAGKNKAEATLKAHDLAFAWEVFETPYKEGSEKFEFAWKSFDILVDMVSKLVKYGTWSPKQFEFADKLVARLQAGPPPAPKKGEFVGTIKKREFFTATLKVVTGYETQFGYTELFIFEDKDGNNLIWKTGSGPSVNADDKGKTFRFKATVKEHSEYKGRNQTIMTRLSDMEEVKPETDGPGSGSKVEELPKLDSGVAELQEKVAEAKSKRDDETEARFLSDVAELAEPKTFLCFTHGIVPVNGAGNCFRCGKPARELITERGT